MPAKTEQTLSYSSNLNLSRKPKPLSRNPRLDFLRGMKITCCRASTYSCCIVVVHDNCASETKQPQAEFLRENPKCFGDGNICFVYADTSSEEKTLLFEANKPQHGTNTQPRNPYVPEFMLPARNTTERPRYVVSGSESEAIELRKIQ